MCAEAKSVSKEEEIIQARIRAGLCPDCGGQLRHQEGTEFCPNCGYQRAPC